MYANGTGSSLAFRRKKRNQFIFYTARFMIFFVKKAIFDIEKKHVFWRTVKNKKF